jgi:hypothetical protein
MMSVMMKKLLIGSSTDKLAVEVEEERALLE